MTQIHSHTRTDVGRHRDHNEDAWSCSEGLGLYIVCDGMGGHAAGEVASRLAADTVTSYIRKVVSESLGIESIENPREQLERAIMAASEAVFQMAQDDESKRGMGTTLTAMWFVNRYALVGHVGDSRAYLVRQGQGFQLTEDHTLANELFKLGRLNEEQLAEFPFKNALSRSVGLYPSVQVDVLELEILPGDCFLLCTDGLHGYFDSEGFPVDSFFSHRHSISLELVEDLVSFANQHGGKDNITAMALQIAQEEETLETQLSRQTMTTLQGIRLFAGLSYKEYIQLFNLCEGLKCLAGSQIIKQGHQGEALYVVIEGSVIVQRDGQELARLGPGEHFGELSLIDHQPRFADVYTATPSYLIYLTRDKFETLLQEEPGMGIKLLRHIMSTLTHIVRDQSMRLLEQSPSQQVVRDTLACDSFALIPNKSFNK